MLSTRSLVSDLTLIPTEWMFEHYLGLDEKLDGQELFAVSRFSAKDTNPSLHVYVHPGCGKYRYKDFSSGKGGDAVDLVMNLHSLYTRGEAAHKIIEDYNKFIVNNSYEKVELKVRDKYKLKGYERRLWTKDDARFWTQFNISSNMLERYQVSPLSYYEMEKEDEDRSFKVEGRYMYGYFRLDGTLYKIYQPYSERKFLKIKKYIQGTDQLRYESKYLVITSSLKDIMALDSLGFGVEIVAPDSENVLIEPNVIQSYKASYKAICVMFDNDEAGIRAMETYSREYRIPGVRLEMSKDISDSIKDHGSHAVQQILFPILKDTLTITL
jgi:hypothetical protein